MRTRFPLPLLVAGAALVAALAAPSASSAAVSCSYSAPTYTTTITMTSANDTAILSRFGTLLTVNGATCPGLPSVTNTGSIVWNDTSGAATTAVVDLTAGPIGPGKFINIGDPSGSIGLKVTAGAGVDTFRVIGTGADETFAFGHGAVDDTGNLDAAAELANPDADVVLQGVEQVQVDSGDGADTITGQGGLGSGSGPLAARLIANGQGGADTITGGAGSGALRGGPGDDTIKAGGGQVSVMPGEGDDTAKAGPGTSDSLSYADAPAGVRADLTKTVPQDTGGAGVDTVSGFENLSGSDHDDVLAGDDGNNAVSGLAGTDTVMGRGGDDLLLGNTLVSEPAQLDTLSYEDPSPGVFGGVAVSLFDLPDAIIATGTEGTDRINGFADVVGSPYADTITGNAGANRIDAGGGADTVDAGAGPDTLLLRDGVGDTADCGGDADTVTADLEGIDNLAGCEQALFTQPASAPAAVTQTAGVTTTLPAGTTPDTALTFNVSAAKRQRLSRKGTLAASLACPAEPCSARVATTITIASRDRTAKVVTLRGVKAGVSLAEGRPRTVALRLSTKVLKRVKSALRGGKRVTVKVAGTGRDNAGNVRRASRKVLVRR